MTKERAAHAAPTSTTEAPATNSRITKDLQQKCLDIFANVLTPSSDDVPVLQEIKGHLYDRNFAEAFRREEYLRVYASRWSPSRALAYLQVFDDLSEDVSLFERPEEIDSDGTGFNIVCIGGGAGGELVALAGSLSARLRLSNTTARKLRVTLIDIADWGKVVTALSDGIRTAPVLSEYASQSRKESNRALLDNDQIEVDFKEMDVLNANTTALVDVIACADLVTFMFTLNELYTTSMSKTQQLLSKTLSIMPAKSHLLVVDSPGSYSTVSINGTAKKYPMQWLLDYALLGDPRKPDDGKAEWTKVRSEESKWFRLPDSLEYAIDLEDMRYQIHLYKRLSDTGD